MPSPPLTFLFDDFILSFCSLLSHPNAFDAASAARATACRISAESDVLLSPSLVSELSWGASDGVDSPDAVEFELSSSLMLC